MSIALQRRIKDLEAEVAKLAERVAVLENKPKVGRPPKDQKVA